MVPVFTGAAFGGYTCLSSTDVIIGQACFRVYLNPFMDHASAFHHVNDPKFVIVKTDYGNAFIDVDIAIDQVQLNILIDMYVCPTRYMM